MFFRRSVRWRHRHLVGRRRERDGRRRRKGRKVEWGPKGKEPGGEEEGGSSQSQGHLPRLMWEGVTVGGEGRRGPLWMWASPHGMPAWRDAEAAARVGGGGEGRGNHRKKWSGRQGRGRKTQLEKRELSIIVA